MKPLRELTAADVETLLSDYQLPRPDATPRLVDFYAAAVRHLADDGELSDTDRAELTHLRYVLGLEDQAAEHAQRTVLREVYCSRLEAALSNGHLSEEEKTELESMTKRLACRRP